LARQIRRFAYRIERFVSSPVKESSPSIPTNTRQTVSSRWLARRDLISLNCGPTTPACLGFFILSVARTDDSRPAVTPRGCKPVVPAAQRKPSMLAGGTPASTEYRDYDEHPR